MKQHPYDRGIDRLFAVLADADDPLTIPELSVRAHLAVGTLQGGKYLPHLAALGLVHVAAWRKQPRGRYAGAYVIGPGRKPPRPPFCRLRAAREWKRQSGYTTRRMHARALSKPSGMLAFIATRNA